MQTQDNRYSLVIEGGYDKLCWRLKNYPKKKEDVKSFMKQEVRGLVGELPVPEGTGLLGTR